MHTCGSLRGSVTAVVERWILTVPLSPFPAAGGLPPPAVGDAPAPGPAKASVKTTATSVTPSRNVSRLRQVMMVMKTPLVLEKHGDMQRNAGGRVGVTQIARARPQLGLVRR